MLYALVSLFEELTEGTRPYPGVARFLLSGDLVKLKDALFLVALKSADVFVGAVVGCMKESEEVCELPMLCRDVVVLGASVDTESRDVNDGRPLREVVEL